MWKFVLVSVLFCSLTLTGFFAVKRYERVVRENQELKQRLKEKEEEVRSLQVALEELQKRKNQVIVKYKERVVREKENCEELLTILNRNEKTDSDTLLNDLNGLWPSNKGSGSKD